MNRVLRVLRHRVFDERDTRRAIGPAVMERLQQRVAASECRHSGEIRVCVEAGLPLSYLWRGLSARQRAITLFGKLRVWDTAHNNGVLIYLLLAEHAIEFVADRALARRVAPETWQAIVDRLGAQLRAGGFEDGLTQALEEVSALLVQHFPSDATAPGENELPDTVLRA